MPYKILVVDDEEPVRKLFKDLLTKEKHDVKYVSSAEEALDWIEKDDFDIMLLDIKLPGISGLEALKLVKDKKPDLTVIMITGYGYDEELIAKCRELGCSGYIGKNMPISQIMSSFKLFVRTAEELKKRKK
jgi:DNA-binding NtrC family response regulator